MATKGKAGNTEANTSAAVSYASAMDKLRDEMAKDSSEYVRVVGEYLTNYLLEHPEAEAALLNSAKTIHGSLKQIEDEARKHKQGNVGIVSDVRAFGLVLEYFGIVKGATGKTSSVTELRAAPPDMGLTGPVSLETAHSAVSRALDAQEGKAEETAPAFDPFDLDALLGVG